MKKLHSFEELRKEVGLKPVKPKEEKEILCRKCGSSLKKVADNAYICEHVNEKGKACGNIYIRKGTHSF